MEIIREDEFEEKVLKNDKLVLVDFFANWCGPCKMLSPVLEEVSNEVQDIEIFKVNIDDDENLAKKFGVMSIPTMIYFSNGVDVEKVVGYRQKNQILETINNLK